MRATVRVLLVLALLLVAGCAAPGGPTVTTPTDGSSGLPRPEFAPPVDISGPRGGPEPVIVVGEDGTIYVAAQDAAGGAPHVWVSNDGGKVFSESRPTGAGGGEVDIAVGKGIVFVTQLSPNGNVVSYSKDKGASWSQTAFAGTSYFERELVAVDAAGSAYLVARFGLTALNPGSRAGDEASVARSDDGGVTFIPAGRAWDPTREPGLSIGNLVASGSMLGLAYNCRDGNAVCFAKSTDRGASWSQHLVAARSVAVDNVYPILAAGSRLVITWSDASDGRLAVWAASSGDNGASWSAPARVSASDESATLPWVATGGATWVVYLSTTRAITEAGAKAADGAEWRATAVRLDDALTPQARGPVLPEPVHIGVLSKPVGRPGEDGPFDRSFGDFFTVAVGKDGKPLVAVVKTVGGSANVLVVRGT